MKSCNKRLSENLRVDKLLQHLKEITTICRLGYNESVVELLNGIQKPNQLLFLEEICFYFCMSRFPSY